jgi:polysaccharide transporter, PST family
VFKKITSLNINFSKDAKKIAHNVVWLFGDQILRMGLSLIIGVYVARYLGPENLGTLSYAMALVGIAGPLAGLGLNQIVVRDLVRQEVKRDEVLGTALVLKFAAALTSFLLVIILTQILQKSDYENQLLIAVIAVGSIFQVFDVIEFWFQSQVKSRHIVTAKLVSLIVTSIAKVFLVFTKAPLIAFACIFPIESILNTLSLIVVYYINGYNIKTWKFRLSYGISALKESWPLLLNTFAVVVYTKIDQVMLQQMVGSESVGIYAVAAKISEVWYFIPSALTASFFPLILEAKQVSEEVYHRKLQQLFLLMALISLSIAFPMTFLSEKLISTLYGDSFSEAGLVLAIHIWSAVFVFLGTAQGPWNISEGLQKLSLTRGLLGGIINIVLNIILIPSYGAIGASIATLVSYAVSNYFSNLFNPRTIIIFKMQTKAILLIGELNKLFRIQ